MPKKKLAAAIAAAAGKSAFPDDTPCSVISCAQVHRLAEAFDIGDRLVEIQSLRAGVVPERYMRNMRAYSRDDQARLLEARVGVVGLGGLGGSVVEILARLGIGHLTLIDGDIFEDSNLNRQLLSTVDLLGSAKAPAAAARVRAINPSLSVVLQAVFLNAENGPELLASSDVVVDCLDSIDSRRTLQAVCRDLEVPLVSAAVAGASGQLATIFPEDPGFDLIYGATAAGQPQKGAEASLGTLPFAVMLMASLECAEVARILLKKESRLQNRLLVVDLNDYTLDLFRLA